MKALELWREAARNFSTGASKGLLSLLAFLVLVLVLGFIAVRSVAGVSLAGEQFRNSGASVFRIDADGAVNPAACDALATVEGIDAAGATRKGAALNFASLPELPTPYFEATAGMAGLLGAEPGTLGAGLVLESELGSTLGLGPESKGTFLASGQGPIRIAGTFSHPDDGRDATLNGAALGISTDADSFDSCWARFWPPVDNPLELLSLSVSNGQTASEASQWNPKLGRSFDPQAQFDALPLTTLVLAAAVISAVLSVVLIRLRRLEIASARHIGVSAWDMVGMVLAETSMWMVPAVLVVLSCFVLLALWNNPDPMSAAWLAGARVAVAAAGAWCVAAGVAAACIRQTHLVRYFQQR